MKEDKPMNVKVSLVLVSLCLINFPSPRAHACTTAGTDMSGGGWETSAAADPCSSVIGPTTLQGHINTSPAQVVPSGRRSYAASQPNFANHNRLLPVLLLSLLPLWFGLNRREPEFSRGVGTRAMVEAGL